MSDLAQPFYVERDGLRGVIMPMPDGRFNYLARATITMTGTCESFDHAHEDLESALVHLAGLGDVVQEEQGAPATVVAISDVRPSASNDDKGEGLLE
jgi:hypothetical protein